MGKFNRTLRLMGASWNVLARDRKLILFPLFSSIALALVIASFAVPLFNRHTLEQFQQGAHHDFGFYVLWFLFYFVSYLVAIFFNSALIASVLKCMDGETPTLGYGLRAAWERLPQIVGWALMASTVGFILRMIEQRVGFVGRLVVWFLGTAWSVTSFLVVPVLVAEGRGPIDAYRESASLFRRSWGEQIIGNVGFGLIFLLAFLPVGILLGIVLDAYPPSLPVVVSIGVVYLVGLGLVQSTLQSIYQAAVYRYAADGTAPRGFDDATLAEAFRSKG